MTAERVLAWATAVACVAVFWASLTGPTPVPSGRLVAIGLGTVVAMPLAVVFLRWLSGLRGGTRGWS